MEEPWLVRADDYKQMTTGELAYLYLMNPKTAFGRASKAIFAMGEIRRAWMAGRPTGAPPTHRSQDHASQPMRALYPFARSMERSSDGVTTGISDPLKSLPFRVTR